MIVRVHLGQYPLLWVDHREKPLVCNLSRVMMRVQFLQFLKMLDKLRRVDIKYIQDPLHHRHHGLIMLIWVINMMYRINSLVFLSLWMARVHVYLLVVFMVKYMNLITIQVPVHGVHQPKF